MSVFKISVAFQPTPMQVNPEKVVFYTNVHRDWAVT